MLRKPFGLSINPAGKIKDMADVPEPESPKSTTRECRIVKRGRGATRMPTDESVETPPVHELMPDLAAANYDSNESE
jgi:hypothetical protein